MFDEMKCHIFGYENSYIFHFVFLKVKNEIHTRVLLGHFIKHKPLISEEYLA